MPEVPGDGDPVRRGQALSLVEAIADPCSASFGRPTGLVSMGIIDRLDLGAAGEIELWIMPTIPGCLFLGVIEERIEMALAELGWCSRLCCHRATGLWEPSRMRPAKEPVAAA